jgi:hypothetical protein
MALACAVVGSSASEARSSNLIEWRVYVLDVGKLPLLESYLAKAFVPALKRLECGPVGAFVEQPEPSPLRVHVVVVHPSAESAATLAARLAADADHRRDGQAYLDARAADPVYHRVDSSLLKPIASMPRLERPDPTKSRIFNFRVYESHNERAAKKKIEMFDKGELAIFRRVGLTPVFIGETVVGPGMPNLTYLLTFPDEAARAAAWKRFREDEEWKKMKALPEYADKEIVSKIHNLILSPLACSEI